MYVLNRFGHVRLFAILWTVACQAALLDSLGKIIGVGCHALIQGIFPTQGSNPCLLHLLCWQASILLKCTCQYLEEANPQKV